MCCLFLESHEALTYLFCMCGSSGGGICNLKCPTAFPHLPGNPSLLFSIFCQGSENVPSGLKHLRGQGQC